VIVGVFDVSRFMNGECVGIAAPSGQYSRGDFVRGLEPRKDDCRPEVRRGSIQTAIDPSRPMKIDMPVSLGIYALAIVLIDKSG
jgi:hypothetical protein